MTLDDFNALNKEAAREVLGTVCGSEKWQQKMLKQFPFVSENDMVKKAGDIWYDHLKLDDWMQAFSQHPKIGDLKSLREKFASTGHLAGEEQAAVKHAGDEVLAALAHANELYESKFGFIFIVFATGKSAGEMLRLLHDRLVNSYDEELLIAMGEQLKIAIQRFKNILPGANWEQLAPSHITTHVLDTSLGRPAAEVSIRLKHFVKDRWQTLAQGITNHDGRIGEFLPSGKKILPGPYRLWFDTGRYFDQHGIKAFYPEVEIFFTIENESHYHVPLLLNPFGYSTYRGS